MKPIEMIELINQLATNLENTTNNNAELDELERKYLYGLVAGLKLASITVKATLEDKNGE